MEFLDPPHTKKYIESYRRSNSPNFVFFACAFRKVREKGCKLLSVADSEGKASASFLSGLSRATSAEEIEALAAAAGVASKGSKATLAARAIQAGLEEAALQMMHNAR